MKEKLNILAFDSIAEENREKIDIPIFIPKTKIQQGHVSNV